MVNPLFHDLRGPAVTKFYVAGPRIRGIAEILGWDEEHVEKLIRRYVGRTAASRRTIDQLNRSNGVICELQRVVET
jgi:transposase